MPSSAMNRSPVTTPAGPRSLQNGTGSPFPPFRVSTLACFVCFTGALLIFLVPLLVPMRPVMTVSAAYLAGYNNQIAVILAAGLSVSVFAAGAWWQRAIPAPVAKDGRPLTRSFVFCVVALSTFVLGLCCWLVAASHLRYLGDAGYIIEVATVKSDTGRALYSQLEFAYGPLLIDPEIWLSRWCHVSMTAAYYVVFLVQSALGLLMVAYILNSLPILGSLRRAAFLLLAIGAVTPHLGLNYTFFRFASPFAFLLLGMRQRRIWQCALVLALGEAFELLISPELALAMGIGVLTFGILRLWVAGWRWSVTAILPLGTLVALLLIFGQPFLHTAANFSRGALNLPIGPYPHLLVYLFAVLWLVPFGLSHIAGFRDEVGAQRLAFYATSLAFLPPALGRCDPLHVLFDGVGFLLLSLIAISQSSLQARRTWVAALALLVFWNHWVNERLFDSRNAQVLREAVMPHLSLPTRDAICRVVSSHRPDLASVLGGKPQASQALDMQTLEVLTQGAPIATPADLPPTIERQLREARQYAPGYYTFGVDVLNVTAEQRTIADVNAEPFMLLPQPLVPDNPHTLNRLRSFQGITLPYRTRNRPQYDPGTAFKRNLHERWVPVQRFGPYMLYRQAPTGAPAD